MTAPVFRIRAPPGTELKLPRDAAFQGNEILVLGVDPMGHAGMLAPFARTRCRSSSGAPVSRGAEVRRAVRVEILSPEEPDAVDWEGLEPPAGVDPAEWEAALPYLASAFGRYWPEFRENLAGVATRLGRRGIDPTSVLPIFRQAYREATGLPSAAAVGRVTGIDEEDGLAEHRVVALGPGGTPVSCATTDAKGRFSIEGLEWG